MLFSTRVPRGRVHDTAVAKYAEIAQLLAPHVDLIICETIASVAHARAVLEGVTLALGENLAALEQAGTSLARFHVV